MGSIKPEVSHILLENPPSPKAPRSHPIKEGIMNALKIIAMRKGANYLTPAGRHAEKAERNAAIMSSLSENAVFTAAHAVGGVLLGVLLRSLVGESGDIIPVIMGTGGILTGAIVTLRNTMDVLKSAKLGEYRQKALDAKLEQAHNTFVDKPHANEISQLN